MIKTLSSSFLHGLHVQSFLLPRLSARAQAFQSSTTASRDLST